MLCSGFWDQNGSRLRVTDRGSSAMPIRSLLSQTSFNPDQTEMIAKAFDDAWAQLQGRGVHVRVW